MTGTTDTTDNHAVAANLRRIFDPVNEAEYERTVEDEAGLSRRLRRQYTHTEDCEIRQDGDSVVMDVLKDGGALECVVSALGLPDDWERHGELRIGLRASSDDLLVTGMVFGRHERLVARAEIPAGSDGILTVPLHELSLTNMSRDPLPLYTALSVKLQVQWGDTWPDEGSLLVGGIPWQATAENAPTRVIVRWMELIPYENGRDVAVYDRYGQYKHADLPQRVTSDSDLIRERDEEAATLAAIPLPEWRSRYGGLVGSLRFETTGFFRVEQDDRGQWWYVDPEGHPFWAYGFCCTGNEHGPGLIEGKEFLYDELPDKDGPHGDALVYMIRPGPDGRRRFMPAISFLEWNILRKYGDKEAWARRVLDRFERWGVNCLGNWSAHELFRKQRPFPYCRAMLARLDSAPRVCTGFPDVFAPEWPEHFDAQCAETLPATKDDPWLIGHFCDNEMPWGGLDKGAIFRGTNPDSPVIREFERFMRERYGGLAGFNRDFGAGFTEWAQVRRMTGEQLPQVEGDLLPMVDFAEHFAERYFSVVLSCIKKHDPNHLYLGCRFVRNMPHERIVAAAGRHCDVMSVNCYSLWPHEEEFSRWHEVCGRPIQLGELGLPGESHSSVRPCFPVFNAETIGELVKNSGERWSKQPWSLGFHWFPHEALTGIQDRPGQPFIDALRHITEHLPKWRGLK